MTRKTLARLLRGSHPPACWITSSSGGVSVRLGETRAAGALPSLDVSVVARACKRGPVGALDSCCEELLAGLAGVDITRELILRARVE
jgi:hypothetical protein